MIANPAALLTGDRLFKLGQRLPHILIMIAAYLAAQTTWETIALWIPPSLTEQNEVFVPPAYEERLEPTKLWRWSNFVDMYKVPKAEKPSSTNINLKVAINGLIYSEEGSFAMLKIEKDPVKLFGEKDQLKKGVSLDRIDENSITLRQGDLTKVVELRIGKSDLFLEAAPDVPEVIEVEEAPQSREDRQPEDTVEDIAIKELSADYQHEINKFQEKIITKPLEAIKDVELKPVEENGSLLGWSLRYNVNPTLLRALGLLPSDIIMSVNDIPAGELASNPSLVTELMGLKAYKVVVRRDGATKTFNFKR